MFCEYHRAGTCEHGTGLLGCWSCGLEILEGALDGNTKEARRACREKLFSSAICAGSDPTDFIAKMDDIRLRLADMGEEILDDTYACLLYTSPSPRD